jgi:excinuclease ABC subunit C
LKINRNVIEKLDYIPNEPGIYIMEDRGGDVLYVGKGKDLKSRVKSYFQVSRPSHPRIDALVSKVRDIQWVVTDSEVEALILESNLIKEYTPHYNVNLKDDKRYPYVKVTVNEAYPRILVTRRLKDDGARYFGPYTAVKKMRQSLHLINKIFPVRSCHYDLPDERPERVCLDFHIEKCLGPCHGYQTEEEYRKVIDEVILFLSGRNTRIIKDLERELKAAIREMAFEKAARLRDQIESLKTVREKQKVFSVQASDQDLVALHREKDEACGLVMKVREGRLLGSRHLYMGNTEWQEDSDILSLFLIQFYQTEQDIAKEILLPYKCDDLSLLVEWFSDRGGKVPAIKIPRRGEKRKLIDLALKNCRLLMAELKMDRTRRARLSPAIVNELGETLELQSPPRKIVCLDISELKGGDAVGSLVRFDDGRPRKSEYRRFRIRSVEGQNDVAMMTEILERYLHRKVEEDDLPDLILLDGGKGQLSAGVDVLGRYSLGDIPIFALAKKNEELYGTERHQPMCIPRNSSPLRLLCQIRDEAHRFAVDYHRNVRSRRYRSSALDSIPGVGEVRKRNLLRAFGSVKRIRAASVEDIARVEGFSIYLSKRVKSYLQHQETH